jgi:hypothetical protein
MVNNDELSMLADPTFEQYFLVSPEKLGLSSTLRAFVQRTRCSKLAQAPELLPATRRPARALLWSNLTRV